MGKPDLMRLLARVPAGHRAVCALLAALVLCASPASVLAQSPLGPLPSQPTSTPTISVPTTSTAASGGGGLSTAEQIGLFAAGVLMIGGIAFLIRRDARSAAPTKRQSSEVPRATVKPQAKRVEQSRARAKAARRQRKRTR